MWRIPIILATLLLGAWTHGNGNFGVGGGPNLRAQNIFGAAPSVQPGSYYTPGTGGPAVSTSDYYHLDGWYGGRPYDLTDPACGTAGTTLAASRGRYVWVVGPDHPVGNANWQDGQDFRIGFSNDPGVLPAKFDTILLFNNLNSTTTSGVVTGGTGGVASSTLAVTGVTSGAVSAFAVLSGTGVTAGTTISTFNGVQSGAGLTGNYALSAPATIPNGTTLTLSQSFALYQFPWLVCNPDDASFAFYIYAEGFAGANNLQHEEGFIKSNDMVSWTSPVPSHINPTFTNWSSFQRVVRDGVNSWHSTGLKAGGGFAYFSPAFFTQGKWTSSNGLNWVPASVAVNQCLPTVSSPNGAYPCANGASEFFQSNSPDSITVSAQAYQISREDSNFGVANPPQYLTRAPIDANFNLITSPATVRVSSVYTGIFPGPTYLQVAGGYVEDGVAHYYVSHGFFTSAASVSGNVLVDNAPFASGGGLWQENIDYYTEITDASLAVNAAPVGVVASAAGGVVALSWYNALPNQTYRIYRGTTAASQTTLVGDVTGVAATDAPNLAIPAVLYYKVVTLNSGVEKQSRVVSTYVSSSVANVNAHMTRVLAAGADPATIDRAWLDSIDSWLTSNGLYTSLMLWTDPAFGVTQNASGVVSTVFDYGTTRLPRGGDYTPCTGSPCTGASTTTYSPVGLNGTSPAWTNPNTNSFGYYGGPGTTAIPGRVNNIRRKTELTVVAAYKKPNTNLATLLAIGEFGGLNLQHTAGSPGNASFCITPHSANCTSFTSTVATSSATAFHVIAGTFDGTTATAYADGVAGTGVTGYTANPNLQTLFLNNSALNTAAGYIGTSTSIQFLESGAQDSKYTYGTGYLYDANQAQFTASDLIVFEKALTPTQVASLTTLITNRVVPPPVKVYNIVTDFSATCNGTADDASAFATFNSTALTFQAGTPGLIELDIPNSKCLFKTQAMANNAFAAGIKQLRVVALGTSSELSDNTTGFGFTLGSNGATKNGANPTASSYISTVAKGSSTVTLLTPAQHTLFNIGDWMLVAGVDLQGGGQPPNPGFHDWVKITAKNTGTGVLTFTPALTHSYESTWPVFSAGTAGSPDEGGAALVYQINQNWDTVQEYNGLKISQVGQTNSNGRDITFKNVTMSGAACAIPSQNMTWRVINVTGTSCVIEMDKIVDQVLVQNSAFQSFHFQSASINQLMMSETTLSANLQGTPVDAVVFNSSIVNPEPGALCCGVSATALFSNSTLTNPVVDLGANQSNVDSAFTMSGGVMSQAHASGPASWAIPGGNYYFLNGSAVQFPFTITDISQSGGNWSITTSLGGGYPSAGPLSVHAAPVAVTIH